MTEGNIMLKELNLLSVASSTVALLFAAGCYTYTPEELAIRLKKEVSVPERLPASVEKRASAALLGEWEGTQKELNSFYWWGESTEDIHFVFQFFEDNTLCEITTRKGLYSRHSTTLHGSWRYADGKLEMYTYKDGIMRRELPMRLFWRSDTLVEVRYDSLSAEKDQYTRNTPGKTYKYTSKYDEDGFWLRFIDREENDIRMMSAHARSPLILTRVGDAMRPPSGVAMQNPVEVNQTTVSPGAIRAQQDAAEAFSCAAVALANGVGGAMSQRHPIPQSTFAPQIPQSSQVQTSTTGKTATSIGTKTFSYKRKCGVCGGEYDIRFGCPYCKAPEFGVDWKVKCSKCGYLHISGKPCPRCN